MPYEKQWQLQKNSDEDANATIVYKCYLKDFDHPTDMQEGNTNTIKV